MRISRGVECTGGHNGYSLEFLETYMAPLHGEPGPFRMAVSYAIVRWLMVAMPDADATEAERLRRAYHVLHILHDVAKESDEPDCPPVSRRTR